MFAGGYPVPLGVWVDLENMGPGTEDRLLPERQGNTGMFKHKLFHSLLIMVLEWLTVLLLILREE